MSKRENISIHALREEGDIWAFTKKKRPSPFLSTPSARRATQTQRLGDADGADFYPRPPRGGRRRPHHHAIYYGLISIHALREEGDLVGTDYCQTHDISIHALREEGDMSNTDVTIEQQGFLSTPSARRAT